MNLSFEKSANAFVIYLDGELDEYAARMIRADVDKLIDTQNFKTLTLDMQNVTFIDSTGLGFVFGRYKKVREKHAELLVANVSKQVDKVFATSGVYKFVPKV